MRGAIMQDNNNIMVMQKTSKYSSTLFSHNWDTAWLGTPARLVVIFWSTDKRNENIKCRIMSDI